MAKCDCGYCRVCVEYQDKSATRIIDELIASWLGFTVCGDSVFLHEEERGLYRDGALKKYSTSDAAAVSLLPELVKRGYCWEIASAVNGSIRFQTVKLSDIDHDFDDDDDSRIIKAHDDTIAAAITSAICQLIKDT